MSSLMAKISSIKQIIEGLGKDNNSEENKVLLELTNIIYEIAEKVDKLENTQQEINEYVTVLDENLGNIEEEIYGFEEEDEEFNLYDYVDIKCNKCCEMLAIEKHMIQSEKSIPCPNCHNNINLNNK